MTGPESVWFAIMVSVGFLLGEVGLFAVAGLCPTLGRWILAGG